MGFKTRELDGITCYNRGERVFYISQQQNQKMRNLFISLKLKKNGSSSSKRIMKLGSLSEFAENFLICTELFQKR